MRRAATLLAAIMALSAALLAPAARAESFGLHGLDITFAGPHGETALQAGSHPFAFTTSLAVNTEELANGQPGPIGQIKDLITELPPGLIGWPTATPRCSAEHFAEALPSVVNAAGETVRLEALFPLPNCSDATVVGQVKVIGQSSYGVEPSKANAPLYNLIPPPGVAARLGFEVPFAGSVLIDFTLANSPPYNLIASVRGISQQGVLLSSEVTAWGNPASPLHDHQRGLCGDEVEVSPGEGLTNAATFFGVPSCPSAAAPAPFLAMPTSCGAPLRVSFAADSWTGETYSGGLAESHDNLTPPNPLGLSGCERLAFKPTIAAKPTTEAATSPTGLDFSLDVADQGLISTEGLANSEIEKAEVTLPAGMSVNPSQAEGLAVCSEADLARESVDSAPGVGCPSESKIGSVEVESPLIEESLDGALYVAKPYENPEHSLVALYMVIRNQKLGIIVTQPLKVIPDPTTGQLTTIAEELPQLPFSHFRLHFKEGARSPLVSPPACGAYSAQATLYPYSGGAPITTTSAFEIISGPDNSPCPSGATPPFHPALTAGTLNNAAGTYSPFYTRISRTDSEQEITRFSIKLPPGVIGKLAGVASCSDAAIAAAKARERTPTGGQEELNAPSCPAGSEVGHTLVGSGVGPSLTYVPGRLYLAGPYHGSPLSIVSITAAKAGPFDLGTVVVRFALNIDPETAEVSVDGVNSDPIPHIVAGIPVHLRDIRAYVDRPDFTLNPTSCAQKSTASTILGSGLNFASSSDDQPVTVTSPFQAADCANLGFKPKLALSLKGGTKRGATPAFKAVLTYPKKGAYANVAKSVVTLPHSEFLEQAHIGTVCTRVQFKEGTVPGEKCPAASVYGRARAVTPILDEPLEGPVYLRSSSHNLPDLVAALHNGQINIDLDGRIDSVKNGRIRNTFEAVPDAPVSKFTLEMKGGKKGLLVNSTNLCARKNRAISEFTGQNGKLYDTNPVLQAKCGGKAKKKSKAHKGGKVHR